MQGFVRARQAIPQSHTHPSLLSLAWNTGFSHFHFQNAIFPMHSHMYYMQAPLREDISNKREDCHASMESRQRTECKTITPKHEL